jgi:hypothetical protein
LNFIERFSKKYSNIKFDETQPVGAKIHVGGQTDKQSDSRTDEANSRFAQFCERS